MPKKSFAFVLFAILIFMAGSALAQNITIRAEFLQGWQAMAAQRN